MRYALMLKTETSKNVKYAVVQNVKYAVGRRAAPAPPPSGTPIPAESMCEYLVVYWGLLDAECTFRQRQPPSGEAARISFYARTVLG